MAQRHDLPCPEWWAEPRASGRTVAGCRLPKNIIMQPRVVRFRSLAGRLDTVISKHRLGQVHREGRMILHGLLFWRVAL